MGSHPTQSRAGPPLIVGDLSEKEAIQLLSHLGIDSEIASQGVDYVGTSFLLLERFAGLIHAAGDGKDGNGSGGGGKNVDSNVVKAKLLELAALEFEAIGAVGGDEDNKDSQNIVDALKAILAAGPDAALAMTEFTKLVTSGDIRRKLLSGGMLKYDGNTRSVTFASKLAKEAAEQLFGGEVSKVKKR